MKSGPGILEVNNQDEARCKLGVQRSRLCGRRWPAGSPQSPPDPCGSGSSSAGAELRSGEHLLTAC